MKKPKGKNQNTEKQTQPITLNRQSVGIDIDYYQEIIDDPEVSDVRKRELIEIIGAIVINFIDMGFGVHPVQLAQKDGLIQLDEKDTPSLQLQFEKEKHSERGDV